MWKLLFENEDDNGGSMTASLTRWI